MEAYLASDWKPIHWMASSLDDIRAFPVDVRRGVGQALYEAQLGGRHPRAKPLAGFGGAGVLEIVEDHDGDTYRAVYTVRFRDVLYVLHAFKKKAKRGIAAPKRDVDLIRSRLRDATAHYHETHEPSAKEGG